MDYLSCAGKGTSEIIEKKSRFLGEAVRIESLEEAEAYIADVRKKYFDARHHCFAFIVGTPGTPEEIMRSGDDGEPQGTGGIPVLETINKSGVTDVCVVVTRYFGRCHKILRGNASRNGRTCESLFCRCQGSCPRCGAGPDPRRASHRTHLFLSLSRKVPVPLCAGRVDHLRYLLRRAGDHGDYDSSRGSHEDQGACNGDDRGRVRGHRSGRNIL